VPRRFPHLIALLTLGFAGVVARLAFVQLWCHSEFSRRVLQQSSRWLNEAPRRLPIVDRNGAVLAESVRVASCYADPRAMRRPEATVQRLAALLHLPPGPLLTKIRESRNAFVWVKRFLSAEETQALEREKGEGVGLRWEYHRSYPNGSLASSLLGYVGEDGQGLSGMEYAFEADLVDRRAPRRAFRDGRGERVALGEDETAPSETGHLRLSIDRSLQYIAERELEAGMARSRSRGGMILVQDPRTGELLAFANRPALPRGGADAPSAEELGIPAVQWVFEPGSTFKLVTAAAALEEGVVSPREAFNCEGGRWKYSSITINDHQPEKTISFARAMEVSSNIGLAKVGLRVGPEKLFDYIRAFGFGVRAGSELAGESPGLLRPLRQWSGASLPVVSFGQEVGVTALQLAGAYSAVANGGTLVEPRLCLDLQRPDGSSRQWPLGAAVRRVVSGDTATTLSNLLRGVVDRGTGRDAALGGWTVAGKTGTAQKTNPATRTYFPDRFVASFCGYAPASRPRLTIVVVFDEPKGIAWGGYNAGPVFRNVAWQSLIKMGVPPDQTDRLAERPRGGGRT
jgi:cell division protein FtsI (penicillin-binding protein 3)